MTEPSAAQRQSRTGLTDQLGAIISGSRSGSSVDFTKMYDGESDAAHALDYVGRLSADCNSITGASGAWSMSMEPSKCIAKRFGKSRWGRG